MSHTCTITLAGSAASGKTTLAKTIAKELGLQYVSVEAPRCWGYVDVVLRQNCFLDIFAKIIEHACRESVCDNSLLTVAAYSRALGYIEGEKEALRLWLSLERDRNVNTIVLVLGDEEERVNRIQRRMVEEPSRYTNIIEKEYRVHSEAEKTLIEYAVKYDLPILNTRIAEAVRQWRSLL